MNTLSILEPSPRESGPILICDEHHNDVAEFFHNEHATVSQSYETALAYARCLVASSESKAVECLRSIADMKDDEPRELDDADWRFRALEAKRAAQCTIAALAPQNAGGERQQSSDGGAGCCDLGSTEQRKPRKTIEPSAIGSVGKVTPHPAGVAPGPSEATPAQADEARALYRGAIDKINRATDREIDAALAAPDDDAAVAWRSPTPEMLNGDALFEAIWQTIKTWDINVPAVYSGYCGASGNHARAIYDAVNRPRPAKAVDVEAIARLLRPVMWNKTTTFVDELADRILALLRDGNASSEGGR